MRQLLLSVKRRVWRKDDSANLVEPADREFREKREGVLARQNHTCVYCTLRSKKATEAHHLNDNHADNRDENLVAACPLCHAVNHIGQVGIEKDGVMMYIPGPGIIEQKDLNHLMRTLFIVLETGDDAEREEAQSLLDYLLSLQAPLKEAWGTNGALDFANAMLALNDDDFETRETALMGVGLLFKPKRFGKQIGTWIEESYKALPIKTWKTLYGSFTGNRA